MKSLLELEKEIPASLVAVGVDELRRYFTQTWGQSLTGATYRRDGKPEQIVRAIYAAMQYERQLKVSQEQRRMLERASKARFA